MSEDRKEKKKMKATNRRGFIGILGMGISGLVTMILGRASAGETEASPVEGVRGTMVLGWTKEDVVNVKKYAPKEKKIKGSPFKFNKTVTKHYKGHSFHFRSDLKQYHWWSNEKSDDYCEHRILWKANPANFVKADETLTYCSDVPAGGAYGWDITLQFPGA